MQQRKKVFGNIFLSTAIIGTIFLIIEMIGLSSGKSICQTEGCQLAAQYTRFGTMSILLIGLVTFAALALLSYIALYRNGTRFEGYINLVLVVSLSAEGFFSGYQAFRLHNVCVFCLITFGFFLVLGILRILYGEKAVIAGFLSFAAVFAMFYLVLPADTAVHLPDDELILFYGKDCKYCVEVMKEIKEENIKVLCLPVGEYTGLLKNMGIEHVPTLYVNRKNEKIFLTGKETIDQYLFCKQKEGLEKETRANVEIQSKKKPESRTYTRINEANKLFIPHDTPTNLLIQPDDKGICKETDKCE
jgi:hypothetical protein